MEPSRVRVAPVLALLLLALLLLAGPLGCELQAPDEWCEGGVPLSPSKCRIQCENERSTQERLVAYLGLEGPDGLAKAQAMAPGCGDSVQACACRMVDEPFRIATCVDCPGHVQKDSSVSAAMHQVDVVSAFPAIATSIGFVRVCGPEPADSLELVVSLRMPPGGRTCTKDDWTVLNPPRPSMDDQFHPGDLADGVPLTTEGKPGSVGAGRFHLRLDCLADADAAPGPDCAGGPVTVPAAGVRFEKQAGACEQGEELQIVVDNSGSVAGRLDPTTQAELPPGHEPAVDTVPGGIGAEVIRKGVAKLVASLAENQPHTVIEFDETGVRVPCALFDFLPCEPGRALTSGLPPSGRSPVWEALRIAGRRFDPVVLLVDGPDTCSPSEDFQYFLPDGSCAAPCPNAATYAKFLSAMGPRIWWPPIHVIQMGSPAHPAPSPRLQEVACLSGGTYQFLRREDVAARLDGALQRVRHVLSGDWRVSFQLPKAGPAWSPGRPVALTGQLSYAHPDIPSLAAATAALATRMAADQPFDERPRLLQKCGQHTECGGKAPCEPSRCGADGACRSTVAPDGLPCGGKAMCCHGTCAASCGCP